MVLFEAFSSGKLNEFISAGDSDRTSGNTVYVHTHAHSIVLCHTVMTPASLLRTPVLTAMYTYHSHKKVPFDCEEDPVNIHFLIPRLVVWTQSSWLFMKNLHAMCLASCLQMI